LCPSGFNLENDFKTCTDVNECSEGKLICPQICVNTPGKVELKYKPLIGKIPFFYSDIFKDLLIANAKMDLPLELTQNVKIEMNAMIKMVDVHMIASIPMDLFIASVLGVSCRTIKTIVKYET
jgi:hypothetical protein